MVYIVDYCAKKQGMHQYQYFAHLLNVGWLVYCCIIESFDPLSMDWIHLTRKQYQRDTKSSFKTKNGNLLQTISL